MKTCLLKTWIYMAPGQARGRLGALSTGSANLHTTAAVGAAILQC
jgi:hypothetical protein